MSEASHQMHFLSASLLPVSLDVHWTTDQVPNESGFDDNNVVDVVVVVVVVVAYVSTGDIWFRALFRALNCFVGHRQCIVDMSSSRR
mmetsp:Transcript_63061/g.162967  ORF Transcript_63061/g.162967 Transcript_63061/m.162967 type:complete len:87 (-) Transcript_63061:72-332(-)